MQLRAVEMAVRQRGFTLARRSSWRLLPPPELRQIDILLGDSVGEMATYYGLADVALLGGTFRPEPGGQSLIDAAVCGCPILMGPNTRLQQNAAELALAAGAAERFPTLAKAVARAVGLAGDPRRNTFVRNVFAFAAAHNGALHRVVGAVAARLARRVQPKALGAPEVRLRLGR
jgi:3-deoxy-D-manno-octulosonic-acid transferase